MDSSGAHARICLFGKPALYIEGRLQPFGGPRKAIALLAYVLLHRERALSRAALAELLWPDEEDESARAALRRHLHRALSAFPQAPPNRPWVIANKVMLRWNPDAPLEIDTNEYEQMSAAGQRESAVALYRGDYLEDFYDEWVLPERERLRGLQSAHLVELVDERRRALDYSAAIAYAQALGRLDPLREDAIRHLMSLRFAAGDRSGALADFEAFCRRLRHELSADPMDETVALHEAIRNNDLRTVDGGAPQSTRGARPSFPFVGRGAAMQALRQLWQSAARGSAMTAIVSGEAGIGKSRLIGEFVPLAESQGGRVAFGTTATIETEPYQPLAEALRAAIPLLRLDRLEPVKLSALATLVPELRDCSPALPPLLQLEPERNRHRLFDAVASAFEHVADKRPLLVVLEDLHGAGAATIELLGFIVQRLRMKSVLVIASFREEEVDASHPLRAFLRRLEAQRSGHVALGPLEAADVRTLVAAAAVGDDENLAHDIFVSSEGNALFATELLREHLSAADGGSAPSGIAGTVIARLNRLSLPARTLAETAAVIGVGFDAEVVRQACGWSFAEVFDALDELLDGALVRISAQRRGDFAFSHQLVHATVYDGVDAASRRALHRRVASTLERLFPARPSLCSSVARHFDAAEFPAEAVKRYVPAVRYALDVFAQNEAIALATRALEICSDERERFELHRLREDAAARTGDARARRIDCDAMIEIAERCDDDDLLGTALCRTIACSMVLAERDAEAAAIARLRDLSARSASPRWSVETALARARAEILRSNERGAEDILNAAEPVVAGLTDDEVVFDYWTLRAYGAAAHTLPCAREYLERAQALVGNDRARAARALRTAAHVADYAGDALALDQVATRLLDLYLEIGDLEGQALAHQNLAVSAWYRLDVATNREHTERALALFERVEKPHAVAAVMINRGVRQQHLGDFAAAQADYLQARAIAQAVSQPGTACLATANLASLAWLRGDHGEARDLALEALASARTHQFEPFEHVALEYLGSAERDLGLFESAREHHEAALQRRRGRDPRAYLEILIEIIPTYLALGLRDDALAAADELLAGLAGDRMRVTFPAYALSAAASALAADGQLARACALRDEARSLLLALAERIDEKHSRQGYLSLSVHRAIVAGNERPGAAV